MKSVREYDKDNVRTIMVINNTVLLFMPIMSNILFVALIQKTCVKKIAVAKSDKFFEFPVKVPLFAIKKRIVDVGMENMKRSIGLFIPKIALLIMLSESKRHIEIAKVA